MRVRGARAKRTVGSGAAAAARGRDARAPDAFQSSGHFGLLGHVPWHSGTAHDYFVGTLILIDF